MDHWKLLGFAVLLGCSGGAGEDAGAPDASAPDAASPDARTDAPATDGAAPDAVVDAMSDAASEDAGPAPSCAPRAIPALGLEVVAEGFDEALYVAQAPGVSDTLWVLEQPGRVMLARGGERLPTAFLDIRARVTGGGELGLLGLAFHPDYEVNGRFFVYYTQAAGGAFQSVLAEYTRSADDAFVADPTETRLHVFANPFSNHNGGMLAFGPDGFLYLASGDGGGEPEARAQERGHELGKLLRIDVDSGDLVPATNPFVGEAGVEPLIWAYGLRNPWRFSFDRATGELYIADVGESEQEEVDVQPAGSPGGQNHGWPAYEGDAVFTPSLVSGVTDHAEPILTVRHGDDTEVVRGACSITGGYVYRGDAIPALRGAYVYGDFCSPDVGAFFHCDGAVHQHQRIAGLEPGAFNVVTFGEDNAGELYVTTFGRGAIARIVP